MSGLANASTGPKPESIEVFAHLEMRRFQVVHLLICLILVYSTLMGHGTHLASINKLLKAFGMDKVSLLILVLEGNTSALTVEDSTVDLFVFSKVGRGVNGRARTHDEVRL